MAEKILIGDRVRFRVNDYRKGGDSLPESGIVIDILAVGIGVIDWDRSPTSNRLLTLCERVEADGSDPQTR